MTDTTMRGLVYLGAGQFGVQERAKPQLLSATDAIVKLTRAVVGDTDLQIVKTDLFSVEAGRILGNEGVGIVESVGTAVTTFQPGDRVIISCITSCGVCHYCRRRILSHCVSGGRLLGNTIDGAQAEYVRIPYAASSLHHAPGDVDDDALVLVGCTLCTAFEALQSTSPGHKVLIPNPCNTGNAIALMSSLYSPSVVIVLGSDPGYLANAKKLGATHIIESGPNAVQEIIEITEGQGVDIAIGDIGEPATFEICQETIAVGGTIANVGIHGSKITLDMGKLWNRNITIKTHEVDTVTIPVLLRLIKDGRIDTKALAGQSVHFDDIDNTYSALLSDSDRQGLTTVITFE